LPGPRRHAGRMADLHRGAAFDLIGERYEKTFVERAEQWRAGECCIRFRSRFWVCQCE
jgi:hypothetical protein